MSQNPDVVFINSMKETFLRIYSQLFKSKPPVNTGDIGIYQDVLTIKTNNVETSSLYYDVFVKVSAEAVYQNLVEIKILDVFTINASNQNISELVNANIPKYINPNHIKWKLK